MAAAGHRTRRREGRQGALLLALAALFLGLQCTQQVPVAAALSVSLPGFVKSAGGWLRGRKAGPQEQPATSGDGADGSAAAAAQTAVAASASGRGTVGPEAVGDDVPAGVQVAARQRLFTYATQVRG